MSLNGMHQVLDNRGVRKYYMHWVVKLSKLITRYGKIKVTNDVLFALV